MTDNLPPNQTSPVQGFDLNHPTIISLLYLASTITGVTGIIGVILAFVWRGEAHEPWEDSHYQYLINTFWIGLAGTIVGMVLMIVLIGFFVLIGVFVLVVVRSVLSLLKAQKKEPMPNPGTWLA